MNLRYGLIGLGMMGRHHARILRSLPGVELVGVADAMGDPHGVSGDLEVLKSVEDLINSRIDAAVVAVPTQFHEEVGLQLANAGVHALIEKPVAHSVSAAQKLVDAFESNNLIGAVGHIERFNPALMSLRKRLAAGELGEIFQIQTRRQGPFPERIADVGVVKDLGSHDIDLTAWLIGADYSSVAARTAHKSGRTHEDMVSISAELTDGTIANHIVNWLTPYKERITIVTGEKGAFAADTLTADLTFFENGVSTEAWDAVAMFRGVSEGTVTRFALQKHEPLKTEHEAFRDAILGTRFETVTLREGLQTLKVAEAVLESASSGKSVAIR